MIGSLIGGLVVAGLVSSCVKERKAKKEMEAYTENMFSNIANCYQTPRVVTKTVYTEVKNQKLEIQVEFYDDFRALDNKLARVVGEGYKGVAYLINGLKVTKSNSNLIYSLKNIRNYRGRLSHDKRKWKDIPAPDESVMKDLSYAKRWVGNNFSQASNLVYKGKKAFSNKR
jgi:hypothetical protein